MMCFNMEREKKANIVATIGLIYIISMFVEGSVFGSLYLLGFLFLLFGISMFVLIWFLFRQLYLSATE